VLLQKNSQVSIETHTNNNMDTQLKLERTMKLSVWNLVAATLLTATPAAHVALLLIALLKSRGLAAFLVVPANFGRPAMNTPVGWAISRRKYQSLEGCMQWRRSLEPNGGRQSGVEHLKGHLFGYGGILWSRAQNFCALV
jgi:hypothetical protein